MPTMREMELAARDISPGQAGFTTIKPAAHPAPAGMVYVPVKARVGQFYASTRTPLGTVMTFHKLVVRDEVAAKAEAKVEQAVASGQVAPEEIPAAAKAAVQEAAAEEGRKKVPLWIFPAVGLGLKLLKVI